MHERLTKYECSRIIGIRAAQIGMSAPVFIDVPSALQQNFMYIAARELQARALDIIIRRPLPSGKYYEVNVKDLDLPDDVEMLILMCES